jgi:hypothetical protein
VKNFVMVCGGLLVGLLIGWLLVPGLSPEKAQVVTTPFLASTAVPGLVPSAAPVVMASAVPPVENCTLVAGIKLCVKGLAQTKEFTYVMLEIKTPPNIEPQDLGFLSSALIGDGVPRLQDEQGNKKALLDGAWDVAMPGVDHQTYEQILKFSRLAKAVKRATLKFPVVAFSMPDDESFQLDLGKNPKPGDVLKLDQTLTIQGQSIHLSRAEFSGDGVNSLQLYVLSDLVELKGNLTALMLSLGIPKDSNMGTGFGSKMILSGRPYQIFAELLQKNSHLSGLVTIPIQSVSLFYQGDYEIAFDIPEANVSSQIEPTLDQTVQIAEIRRFAGNAKLEPVFITSQGLDNLNIGSLLYLTEDGSEYSIGYQYDQVIQYRIGDAVARETGGQKSPAELSDIAARYASDHSSIFSRLLDDLVLSESLAEGGRHVFRWEDPKIKLPEMATFFLQVTLSESGQVLEYTNTLETLVSIIYH